VAFLLVTLTPVYLPSHLAVWKECLAYNIRYII
jgi:hypothetical protein